MAGRGERGGFGRGGDGFGVSGGYGGGLNVGGWGYIGTPRML